MKLSYKTFLIASLVLAGGGLLAREAGARGAGAPATAPATPGRRIAVVNIVELFDKLLEKTAADTDLSNMKKKSDEEIASRGAEIQKLKDALGTYKENSDQFKQTEDDYLQKSMALDVYSKVEQAKYQRESQLRTIDLYKKINDAVAEYAKANDIGLVFVADSADLNNLRNPDQFSAIVSTRKLMFYDPTYDITPALTLKMNTDFQLRSPRKLP